MLPNPNSLFLCVFGYCSLTNYEEIMKFIIIIIILCD